MIVKTSKLFGGLKKGKKKEMPGHLLMVIWTNNFYFFKTKLHYYLRYNFLKNECYSINILFEKDTSFEMN